jgi:hypothetical protein
MLQAYIVDSFSTFSTFCMCINLTSRSKLRTDYILEYHLKYKSTISGGQHIMTLETVFNMRSTKECSDILLNH